jgi:hypothetical protein
MHSHDYPEFLMILSTLAHGLGAELDDARCDFYWLALKDLTLETFCGAAALAGKYTTRRFPLPGELREYAEQARDDQRAQQTRSQARALPMVTEADRAEGLSAVRTLLGQVLAHLPEAPTRSRGMAESPGVTPHPAYREPEGDMVRRKALLREQLAQLQAQEEQS